MSTNDNAVLQLEALQSLLQHPGWALYKDHLLRTEQSVFHKMRLSKDPDELARLTREFLTYADVLQVPDLLMKPLVMQLAVTKR